MFLRVMYADQVISGPKRSVKDRLDGNIQFRRGRLVSNGGRLVQNFQILIFFGFDYGS